MRNAIMAAVLSFLVTSAAGLVLIPFLRRIKAGQTILEIGPSWHKPKQGTPTMGGFMFMAGITFTVLLMGLQAIKDGAFAHIFVLGFAWLFGAVGFIDDYRKVVNKRNKGLSAIQKLLLQTSFAAAFLALLRYFGFLTPNMYIPFFDYTLPLGWPVFLIFCAVLTVGMVNAVNLTDGVDGLCAGVTMPVAVFFSLVSLAWARPEMALTAAALAGGMLGFLIYNFHPAKVFMGDTGSMFLGGLVCGLAFAADAPLVLFPVGLVYIIETGSVALQVAYFKLTKGKRLFKMSPIHHHFEKSGWSEVKIFIVFTALTVIMCVATFFAVALRYMGGYINF